MPPLAEIAAYLGIGAVVGFFAGLLGIGGAVIIVSSLALMFTARGYPASFVMHLAIGTSLAAMAAGALASLRAHHARGAVDVELVKTMTPGLLAGVFVGGLLARFAPTAFLKYFFLGFVLFNTAQMVFNLRPKPSRVLPGRGALLGIALAIGACSSLFGGGAAAVGIPFLTWCSEHASRHRHRRRDGLRSRSPVRSATSFPGGAWRTCAVGRDSFIAPRLGISATSVVTAPLGARLAHRLKGATLRRIFAVFLVVMGAKVAVSV
jgi:uncharacterized membrane protein YfcA